MEGALPGNTDPPITKRCYLQLELWKCRLVAQHWWGVLGAVIVVMTLSTVTVLHLFF